MEEIIAPIDRDLIKAELTPERFLRHTRKGGNDIYIVNCFNAPHTMREHFVMPVVGQERRSM